MQQVLLIVATLIFASTNVFCQMALTSEQVTKLKNIARDNKTGNGERLRALDELYQTESLLINPDTLKFYGEITIKLARLEDNIDMEANGLIAYGSAFLTVEEHNKADSCFRLAQNLITPQSRPIIRASLLINRALLLSAKGLNDAAIDLYEEAITLGEANNLTRILVAAENNLGNLIAQQGDIATAVKYYARGLELSEQLGDSAGMGNMLSNIGSCNQMLGNLEESRAYFHRAVSIFKKINHPNLPRPLFNIGSTYFGEDSDSLNKYIDLTYGAAGRIGDLSMQSMAYLLKANHLEAENNLVEAEKFLFAAMDLASKANSPLYVNNIKINLASLKGRQGIHSEAIGIAKEVLDIEKSSANLFQ